MGDMGDVFNEYRAYKKERKQQLINDSLEDGDD